MATKLNQRKIDQVEKISMLHFIQDNINGFNTRTKPEDLPVDENGSAVIPVESMVLYLDGIIDAIKRNVQVRIVGSDRMRHFKLDLYTRDTNTIFKICKDIIDNPENYLGESVEDYYYEFTKFLWVEDTYGNDIGKVIEIAYPSKIECSTNEFFNG